MPNFKTLDDLGDVTGKVALVRVDLNLPMADGRATDLTRAEAVAPTILELADRGAKVLLLGVTYKADVADIRESPSLEVLRQLVARGGEVAYCDPLFPALVRPILPCYRTAFVAMENWLDGTTPPPPSATVPRPTSGDPVNSCQLACACWK